EVQVARRLAEIDLRRRLHAVRTRPQVDLIEVHLQDRVLGEVVLDFDRDARFLQLAGQGLFLRELLGEHVARSKSSTTSPRTRSCRCTSIRSTWGRVRT